MLLDEGIDTDRIYANLYLKDFAELKFQAKIYQRIKRTESGVAYLYVSRSMRKRLGMSQEQASAAVSYMDSIRDSLIWLAFIEYDDGSIRVRLRSRFVTVSELAECYRGGMAMKILIPNDDGISSPVLPRLATWAGQLGEVTVVAPKVEQSGKSHAIDFYEEIEIKRVPFPVDCEAWSVDSTPADCVRFATVGLDRSYDLVLSGINRGFNLGADIVYSGTVGAIMEAARVNMKSIALSTDFGSFDAALAELDAIYAYIQKHRLLEQTDLLNINIPGKKSLGIRITRQGGIFYSDRFVSRGEDLYIQVGQPAPVDRDPSTDIYAVTNGYISVTPLTVVRTDLAAYQCLKDIVDKD